MHTAADVDVLEMNMPSNAGLQQVVALALAGSMTGCSWLTVTKPQPGETASAYECTDHKLAPAVDTTFAVAYGLVAVTATAVLLASGDDLAQGIGAAMLVGSVPPALLFGFSAGYGYTNVEACQSLPEALDGPGFDNPWVPAGGTVEGEDPPEAEPNPWLPRE